MNRRNFISAAVLSVGSVVLAGCSLFEDDEDKDKDERRRRRRRLEEDRREDDLDRDRDRGASDLDGIPRSAKRVERDGDRQYYEAGNDGRVYLYDEDDRRLVYSGRLRKGERFVAEPADNRMTIDGKRVGEANLRPSHRYTVYFDRE